MPTLSPAGRGISRESKAQAAQEANKFKLRIYPVLRPPPPFGMERGAVVKLTAAPFHLSMLTFFPA
jgi:hypothetical protein